METNFQVFVKTEDQTALFMKQIFGNISYKRSRVWDLNTNIPNTKLIIDSCESCKLWGLSKSKSKKISTDIWNYKTRNFFGFTLAQTSQFAALAAVYDQFCVWNVGVKISYPTSFSNPGTFSCQLAFAYDPVGGTETPANIYARRTVQIHPLNSIMYPEVNLGTFIPGLLSDDIVVQCRY